MKIEIKRKIVYPEEERSRLQKNAIDLSLIDIIIIIVTSLDVQINLAVLAQSNLSAYDFSFDAEEILQKVEGALRFCLHTQEILPF